MPRNIEIKARVTNPSALRRAAEDVADQAVETIQQDDTFFHCRNGRLKLRDFGNGRGELIYYRREDQHGPKTSFYQITSTHEPEALRDTLTAALGEMGRVRKTRLLYLAGRTRIHLDQVEGLGDFMELEVVLTEDETESAGRDEANQLMNKLGIQTSDLIEAAYVDLLLEQSQ
jgi:predicted adenylyl cyclase CyaB